MSYELKLFFKELEDRNRYNYFLLKKFYYDPKSILNKTKEDFESNIYYDKILIEQYLNDDFCNFLDIVLDEEEFVSKLDYYMIKNLHHYFIVLQKFIENKYRGLYFYDSYEYIELNKEENKKLSKSIKKYFSKKERIEDINKLRVIVSGVSCIKYNKEIKPIKIKEKMLQDALENSPNDLNNPLRGYSYFSDNIIYSFVCENRFLDIIESNFLDNEVEECIIDNIINVLLISIRIKTMDYTNVFEISARRNLPDDLINDFDIVKAKDLISKLTIKKQNKKLIRFPISSIYDK